MNQLPVLGLISHQRRVCRLYKNALRNMESWLPKRDVFRYQAVLLRQRFEQYKNEPDMIKAKRLVEVGEEELFMKQHYSPIKFPESPGGVAYKRVVTPPDWVLDYWHPLEKAHYPEYFARREARKKEFITWWEKQYGKAEPSSSHH